jgi:hypothetical protein
MNVDTLRARAPTCGRRAAAPRGRWRAAPVVGGMTLLLLAAGSIPAVAVEWDIEVVEPAMMFVTSFLTMDLAADGTPHIAHSMEYFTHYAVKSGSEWVIELPYPSEVGGAGVALALDPDGNPWLVFGEGGFEDSWPLRVAKRINGVWSVEDLPDDVAFNANCAMAWSDAGVAHIAYGDGGGALRHGQMREGRWQLETAGTGSAPGFDVSMALDAQGNPYISHWQYGLERSNYEACTYWTGKGWQQQVLDDSVGGCNCIHSGTAIDRKGNPHVVWETHYCAAPVDLRYATAIDGVWQVTTIHRSLGSYAAGCSIALDRGAGPHVAYGTEYCTGMGDSELWYAHLTPTGWVRELVDDNGDAGEINSVRIDADGYLHIAYFAGDGVSQQGEIRYAVSRTPVGPQPGDLNCDGALNTFDIDPFVLALTDEAGYTAAFPLCDRTLADINNDAAINTFDIDPFVQLLTGL